MPKEKRPFVLAGVEDTWRELIRAAAEKEKMSMSRFVQQTMEREARNVLFRGHFETAIPPELMKEVRALMSKYTFPPRSRPTQHRFIEQVLTAGVKALQVGQEVIE